jgi:hypothetical protein
MGRISGVDSVLLAAPGAIVFRALPNHLPAQCAVTDLARPAKYVVVVSYLLTAKTRQHFRFKMFLRLHGMSNLVFT